uniref:Uncharacterized protein n=1 Tax=Ascaris lumbricoides TaxID=6252 RepID=A0A0M3HNW6_ASCLU
MEKCMMIALFDELVSDSNKIRKVDYHYEATLEEHDSRPSEATLRMEQHFSGLSIKSLKIAAPRSDHRNIQLDIAAFIRIW